MKLWELFFGKRRSEVDDQEPASSESASRPRRPVLYFAGGGLDERKMVYYNLQGAYQVVDSDGQTHVVRNRGEYPVMQTARVGGRNFVLRQIDRHVLFRNLQKPLAEDALFLLNTSLAEFAEAYQSREAGRCIMHVPRCMKEGHCAYMFFLSDGEGFALHPRLEIRTQPAQWAIEYERVDFW